MFDESRFTAYALMTVVLLGLFGYQDEAIVILFFSLGFSFSRRIED